VVKLICNEKISVTVKSLINTAEFKQFQFLTTLNRILGCNGPIYFKGKCLYFSSKERMGNIYQYKIKANLANLVKIIIMGSHYRSLLNTCKSTGGSRGGGVSILI
jgi:hypothetical protein